MIRLDVIGHIGRDCTINVVDNNPKRALRFSVAHTRKYKDQQGNPVEQTTWVNCTLWRDADRTQIAQYLTKGTLVHVVGEPQARGFTGNDGTVKAELQLKVMEVNLLGGGRQNENNNAQQQQQHGGAYAQPSALPPDDLHAPADDLVF